MVYDYLFTSQRQPHSVADMDLFIIPSLILSQLELTIELPKLTLSTLMENCDHYSICPGWSVLFWYVPALFFIYLVFEKFIFELDASSFKVTCILLSQVIFLKKMVVLSAKFTILISWPPICIPLILINEVGKYKSIESEHPWWTPHIWIKGSDRKQFIYFNFRFDFDECNFNHVNEFIS